MPTNIKVSFEAENPEQLRALLRTFADNLSGGDAGISAINQPSDTTAEITVEAKPKAKRGRPRKAKKADDAPQVDPGDVVSDLTPDEARDRAVSVMQKFFPEHPECLPQIADLQRKFGIKMFAEVSDERAVELLADIMLIVNGTPDAG